MQNVFIQFFFILPGNLKHSASM